MIGARIREKGDRESGDSAPRRRSRRWRSRLNVSVPAKADEAMIEGCLKAAAEVHHVPAGVLVLLLSVEAGRLGAVSQNANGTVDIGPMQVNDTWLSKIAGHWRASREGGLPGAQRQFLRQCRGRRLDSAPGAR